MKKFCLMVLLAVFLMPQIASSEEDKGYYFAATGGLLTQNDTDLPDSASQYVSYGDDDYDIHNNVLEPEGIFDTGASVTLAIGKSWNRYFRTEFEYGYRSADFNCVNGTLQSYTIRGYKESDGDAEKAITDAQNAFLLADGGEMYPVEGSASGNMSAHSLMANAFLDLANKTRLTPYLGGGIGLAIWNYNYSIDSFTGLELATAYSIPTVPGEIEIYSNTERVAALVGQEDGVDFAYQLLAGVAFDFTDNIKGTAGYRLFGIDNDHDYVVHSAEMGIRYSF